MAISTIPSSTAADAAARLAASTPAIHPTQASQLAETELSETASLSKDGRDSNKGANADMPSPTQIDKAMADMKRALPPMARNLQFSVDTDTGRSVIKVVDPVTKEVIRQMPSEELLAITKSLDSLSGLFVRQKA